MNIKNIKPNPNNPRLIKDDKFQRLVESIRTFPEMMEKRPIICVTDVDGKIYPLGGNMRLKAITELKYKEVPDNWIQMADEWTEEQRREFVIKDNVGFGEWNWDELANEWDSEKLEEWGLDVPDFGTEVHDSDISDKDVGIWVPDCLFKSNNIYDIPTLNPQIKPIHVELPLKPYGADARTKTGIGTYHFYVDDYRFNAIWDNPNKIIESGCKCIVEPNLSLYETTPLSFGIFQIYKKRWIARFLQDYFIDVFVDLNVTEKFMEYNVMGVPEGYNAFFTRGYENRIGALEKELQIAKDISGLENPNLIIYGGSKKVKEFSVKHNLIFINNTTLDI